jgi:hypothetical protein
MGIARGSSNLSGVDKFFALELIFQFSWQNDDKFNVQLADFSQS